MRHLTLFIALFTLLIGTVEAKINYYETLDLLSIEYTVGDSPDVEGIGRTRAVYRHDGEHDEIILSPKSFLEFKSTYLHTVWHELIHWTGFKEGKRTYREEEVDVFLEEVIAEFGALMLSELLYEGKYVFDADDVDDYLRRHPQTRDLTDKEIAFCMSKAYEAATFLVKELKRLDVKNTLQIQ